MVWNLSSRIPRTVAIRRWPQWSQERLILKMYPRSTIWGHKLIRLFVVSVASTVGRCFLGWPTILISKCYGILRSFLSRQILITFLLRPTGNTFGWNLNFKFYFDQNIFLTMLPGFKSRHNRFHHQGNILTLLTGGGDPNRRHLSKVTENHTHCLTFWM